MCGIVACLSRGPIDPERLARASLALQHRGPDGDGQWISPDGKVGLAHRLLALTDPGGGHQPLSNEDGSVMAVVNGEFYDDQPLRRELVARGHQFRTHSDSEVLVHLYEERGPDCLEALRGEFAFVLWDAARSQVLAARDRFGVKPLVYLQWGEELWFASESKALLAAGWPARWDLVAFAHAAATQYPPPDRTFFAGIHQLPPGHLYGRAGPKRYWDLPHWVEEGADIGPLLEDSVCLRLRGLHKPCFALSSGLDSSTVVALARRSVEPHCFCVSFPGHDWDEAAAARSFAQDLGARVEMVEVSPQSLLETLPAAVRAAEGVAVNGHLPAKFLLHQAMRKAGFKTVLTGEGSDEVFLGYAHFFDREAGAHPSSLGIMETRQQQLPLEGLDRILGQVPGFVQAKTALGLKLTGLLAEGRPVRPFSGLLEETARRQQPLEQAAYLWTKTALCQYILKTLSDATEMAHGLEGRTPFLDHRLWEAAARLPVAQKQHKLALREAMRGLMPEDTRLRTKQPFMTPALDCREMLLESGSLFNRSRVLAALDQRGPEWAPALTWVATATLLEQAYRLT
ncbi:MAG: asparagine synthase (glutamine-hydrolyzing) [Vulcanimicrobiota bacterium]